MRKAASSQSNTVDELDVVSILVYFIYLTLPILVKNSNIQTPLELNFNFSRQSGACNVYELTVTDIENRSIVHLTTHHINRMSLHQLYQGKISNSTLGSGGHKITITSATFVWCQDPVIILKSDCRSTGLYGTSERTVIGMLL